MKAIPGAGLRFRTVVVLTVDQIPRPEWDRLFGLLAEGYDFFRVLERSKLAGFNFSYAVVYEAGRVALIAPLFWADFDLAIGVDGLPDRLIRTTRNIFPRFLRARTLFCGSPFGEQGMLGMAGDATDPTALIGCLAALLNSFAREKGLRFILFKDFPPAAADLLRPLERLGFMRGDSFPNVIVDLPFDSMNAYLASLGAGTRKNLRRKVRQAQAAGWEGATEVRNVSAVIEDIYSLYLKTYEQGTVHFEKLTRDYFLEVHRQMGDSARFFLHHVEGRLVAFNLCFLHGDLLIDKFIGMNYARVRKLNLYDVTWYSNVQWCLAHGVRHYQVGQTDCADKLRLGGRLMPLAYHARHLNPLAQILLRGMARLITPVTGAPADPYAGDQAYRLPSPDR
ncbi:MAG: GNAT family N-acetyltransferase [Opitutaceae bacterium]